MSTSPINVLTSSSPHMTSSPLIVMSPHLTSGDHPIINVADSTGMSPKPSSSSSPTGTKKSTKDVLSAQILLGMKNLSSPPQSLSTPSSPLPIQAPLSPSMSAMDTAVDILSSKVSPVSPRATNNITAPTTPNINGGSSHLNTPTMGADYQLNTNSVQTTCTFKECILCKRGTPFVNNQSPTWACIMRIVFYCLQIEMPQKPFLNLKTDVYGFMTSHWHLLCLDKKRSDNWHKQIQDMLSHSKNLFESGMDTYKQNGYWRMKQISDPWEEIKSKKVLTKRKRSYSEADKDHSMKHNASSPLINQNSSLPSPKITVSSPTATVSSPINTATTSTTTTVAAATIGTLPTTPNLNNMIPDLSSSISPTLFNNMSPSNNNASLGVERSIDRKIHENFHQLSSHIKSLSSHSLSAAGLSPRGTSPPTQQRLKKRTRAESHIGNGTLPPLHNSNKGNNNNNNNQNNNSVPLAPIPTLPSYMSMFQTNNSNNSNNSNNNNSNSSSEENEQMVKSTSEDESTTLIMDEHEDVNIEEIEEIKGNANMSYSEEDTHMGLLLLSSSSPSSSDSSSSKPKKQQHSSKSLLPSSSSPKHSIEGGGELFSSNVAHVASSHQVASHHNHHTTTTNASSSASGASHHNQKPDEGVMIEEIGRLRTQLKQIYDNLNIINQSGSGDSIKPMLEQEIHRITNIFINPTESSSPPTSSSPTPSSSSNSLLIINPSDNMNNDDQQQNNNKSSPSKKQETDNSCVPSSFQQISGLNALTMAAETKNI